MAVLGPGPGGPGAGPGGGAGGSALARPAVAPQLSAISVAAATAVDFDLTNSSIRGLPGPRRSLIALLGGLGEQRQQHPAARGVGVGEVVQRLVNRLKDGEARFLMGDQQRRVNRLAGNNGPVQLAGSAHVIDTVEKPNSLCCKAIQARQV